MRPMRAWFLRILGMFQKDRREREFAAELESHLQMHVEDGIRSGLTPAEARRAALIKLGGIEPTKEIYRERRGLPLLETLAQDLAYGVRMMRRNPGFTATVVLTLALGIGATTAIFTVVNAVLLRPLPYPEPDRLVYIATSMGGRFNPFSYTKNYAAWTRHNRTLARIAGYMWFPANFTAGNEAERVNCLLATGSLFSLLGVQPALGRTFLPEEDRPGGAPVVMLENGFWKRRFGGDVSILGKSVTLDARSYKVVGVLPPNFRIPDQFGSQFAYDVWLPFAIGDTGAANRFLMEVLGRLKPGVSIEAARADLDALKQMRLRGGLKESIVVVPWQRQIASGARRSLILFLCAVGFVLLIACVNVANLLLSRAAGREKEIAMRRALGAGRTRILRQLLTESVAMSLLGAGAGLALAYWGKNLLIAFISPNLPSLAVIDLDHRVMVFTLVLALLTGIASGLAPALQASGIDLNESLKEAGRNTAEGRSSLRLKSLLVVFEVALAVVLLSGAGLMFKSFLRLRGVDLGLRPDHILTFDIDLTSATYGKPRDRARFFEEVLARLSAVRGVQSVAGGCGLPLTFFSMSYNDMKIEGRPGLSLDIRGMTVSSDYFRTLSIPIILGRGFTDRDREGGPGVVIVNQSFARRFLSGENILGRHIGNPDQKDDWLAIVGVVRDVRPAPEEDVPPEIYLPYLQAADAHITVVARTAGDPLKLIPTVRSQIAGIDKTQPPHGMTTLDELRERWIAPRRVNMLLIAAFAALALLLGATGIYGVVAYSVGCRAHEIGVRVALGAQQGEILGMVLRNGLRLIAAGAAIGLPASLGLTRMMASELWGVTATDPWTLLAVITVLMASGLVACWLPARRAAKMDPALTLRFE